MTKQITVQFPAIVTEVIRNPHWKQGELTAEDGTTFYPSTYRFTDKADKWQGWSIRELPLEGTESYEDSNVLTPAEAQEKADNFENELWATLMNAVNEGGERKSEWWNEPYPTKGKPKAVLNDLFRYQPKPKGILREVAAKKINV